MPHQCTSCGRTFPDGSKEMLSGCPDCGGNKFQFKPKGRSGNEGERSGAPTASSDSGGSPASSNAESPSDRQDSSERKSSAAAPETQTSSGNKGVSGSSADSPAVEGEPKSEDRTVGTERVGDTENEDTAQASARSDVVTPDELDRASRPVSTDDGSESEEDTDDRPDIDELRDELNEQFESIRIVSPGKYELNLMELYDRQEYIISLQEDGRYVIEMPDAWGVTDE